MTTPYDGSLGTTARCNQEVVGMYYNKRHLAELHRAESFDSDGVAHCRVTLVPEPDNPHDKNGHVSLPDPDLCVPLNDPPSEGWALLPWGSAIQVTKESDHLDVLLDFVPPTGNGQILVTLHLFGAGARTKYDGVEVRLGGERIGELTKASSQKFGAAVRHFDGLGLTTVARAHIKGSSLSAEVTLKAAKAHELTESDLDPEISPLPRLVPYSADADDYDVPPASFPPRLLPTRHRLRSPHPTHMPNPMLHGAGGRSARFSRAWWGSPGPSSSV